MKRLFALLLIVLMLFPLCVGVSAAEYGKYLGAVKLSADKTLIGYELIAIDEKVEKDGKSLQGSRNTSQR